jgi:hypothetical protein
MRFNTTGPESQSKQLDCHLITYSTAEACLHLYMVVSEEEAESDRLAAEIKQQVRESFRWLGCEGSIRICVTISSLEDGRQVEAILRRCAPHFGKSIDDFRAGRKAVLKLKQFTTASEPDNIALMAIHGPARAAQ